MENFDVIIIGAGAAGLICAAIAGQRGRRVLLLDHAARIGEKILISGGGRCNFTNKNVLPERYFSQNPHFCKSALKQYTQHDFLKLVEKHKIAWHEKTLGQLFCDNSARDITGMLQAECDTGHVDIRLQHRIGDITKPDQFRVETDRGAFTSDSLVLASGGLSIPKLGASDLAYRVAEKFGLPLTDIRPALVPLTFAGEALALMQKLTGLSLEITASCSRSTFRENMVFTHRGLSGPAILQISSAWREGNEVTIDTLPGRDAAAYLLERKQSRPKAELKTVIGEILPQRLAQAFCAAYPAESISNYSDKTLHAVAALLKAWAVNPSGSEGYAKAEVTLGGVDTNALSSKTMEARNVPGLYIIGEAVDVTGWLGGYNFQWAWSSGWCAGQAA